MTSQESRARIDIGADVIAQDGEKVGKVDYVVVHPERMDITDIVVGTGGLLGRDVVVPIGAVERVEDNQVRLSASREQLDQFDNYVETRYQQPGEDWTPITGMEYPMQSVLWPTSLAYMQPTEVEINAPPGTVGLSEGMDVESNDGHKVGTVHALETDPSTGKVTAFVVKHGLFFKHDTRIPTSEVHTVHATRVTLKLTREEVERLEREQNPE